MLLKLATCSKNICLTMRQLAPVDAKCFNVVLIKYLCSEKFKQISPLLKYNFWLNRVNANAESAKKKPSVDPLNRIFCQTVGAALNHNASSDDFITRFINIRFFIKY